MRGIQGLGDPVEELGCLPEGDRSPVQTRGEVLAFEEVHHQPRRRRLQIEVMDRDDPGVTEPGEDSRLSGEARAGVGVRCLCEQLERVVTLRAHVRHAVDDAHSSPPERGIHHEVPEALSDSLLHSSVLPTPSCPVPPTSFHAIGRAPSAITPTA